MIFAESIRNSISLTNGHYRSLTVDRKSSGILRISIQHQRRKGVGGLAQEKGVNLGLASR